MAKVMIACPTTGWLHKGVALQLCQWISQTPHQIHLSAPSLKCNEANYQQIARTFWESDYDFLLQIDNDNPPDRNPLELVDLDLDIVTLPTPVWVYDEQGEQGPLYRPFQWNVYTKDVANDRYRTMDPPMPGVPEIQEVEATGAGCLLIARRVFQAPLMQKEGWHRKWDKQTGTVRRGLDLAFSERARKCGFKIWAHWGYRCHHFKELDLLEVLRGFRTWLAAIVDEHGGTLTLEDLGLRVEEAVTS